MANLIMERSKRLLSPFPIAEIDIICQSDNHKLMMSQKQLERIGIVGAGPAGLFLAALLTDKGFCVDVFEQAPSLRADGCGIMLLPNGLRAIKRGNPEVYQDFSESGTILEFFDYYDVSTGEIKTVSLADYAPKYGFPIIYIHRKHIGDALLKFIPDERIHTDYGFILCTILRSRGTAPKGRLGQSYCDQPRQGAAPCSRASPLVQTKAAPKSRPVCHLSHREKCNSPHADGRRSIP